MKISATIALSCCVALALSQGTLAGECGSVSQRCRDPMRGVNLKGTVVSDYRADDCNACITACERNERCNVWVWCDNPNGCDNGYGKIFPHKTCTLKRQDNIHAIITEVTSPELVNWPKEGNEPESFKDWVSGYCNVCPCCGWCSSAKECCSTPYYCSITRECVYNELSEDLISSGISTNCKNPWNDLAKSDCVTKPDQCGAVNPLCPYAFGAMYSDLGVFV